MIEKGVFFHQGLQNTRACLPKPRKIRWTFLCFVKWMWITNTIANSEKLLGINKNFYPTWNKSNVQLFGADLKFFNFGPVSNSVQRLTQPCSFLKRWYSLVTSMIFYDIYSTVNHILRSGRQSEGLQNTRILVFCSPNGL